MNERLLQFIWQFQHFNTTDLRTIAGEPVQILFAGFLNANQGPDFLDAKIKINDTVWAGSIELHVRSSDWSKHGHSTDENYRNVILHVVWQYDLHDHEDSVFPFSTLELCERVPKLLLSRYELLMDLTTFIPCQSSLASVKDITFESWKQRLVVERLLRKTGTILNYQQENNGHWEETCWWLLARNFGAHVNADAFEAMARSISFTVIGRQKKQLIQLEALLLGQAGLLNGRYKEAYPKLLQKEYRYQRTKHQLRPILVPVHFLRMRPGNFPTIRLAQLAVLLHDNDHLFSFIRDAKDISQLREKFDVVAHDYWHYHYRLDEETCFKEKRLGKAMVDSIIMNTIVPMLFAYGSYYKEEGYRSKAIELLEKLSSEENRITKLFENSGVLIKNAFDSQALLELKAEYCDSRRCLECSIGNALLKQQ